MEIEERRGFDRQISIETADWRDLNALRHIERVCFSKDAWPLLDLIGILTFPSVLRFKAVVNGQMVGFVGVDLRRNKGEAWIATICVLPDFRRKGIAEALLLACEEKIDLPVIKLSVRISNQAAIRLYQKFGYQPVEVWQGYYYDGESAQVMQKSAPAAEGIKSPTHPANALLNRITRAIKSLQKLVL